MTQTASNLPPQDRMIADALIEDIVEWRIPPGSWIREREVAERFGVSHAPVREAFRHVANTGFIKVVPWRGAHVIEIDTHATTEVLELWKALFGVVCRMACTALTDEQGQELLRRVAAYKAVVRETRDPMRHLAVSNSVGAYIARRSGAPMAAELLDRVALFGRWQHHTVGIDYISGIEPPPGVTSADLYEQLCLHIVARAPDLADQAARDLIGFSQGHFTAALQDYFARTAQPEPAPRRRRSAPKAAS
jgi:DNA-binding GntR family transcriptional regulator